MYDIAKYKVLADAIMSKGDSFASNGFIWEMKDTENNVEIISIKPTMVCIIDLLVGINFAKSKSDAKRLISSGAVYIDGNKITTFENIEENFLINKIVKVGRKFKKIIR